jgi:DNA-binding response OmpR family regulator
MTTVLIVDDEPDILVLLQLALETAGYTTVQASDGAKALDLIRARHPDLVLLDVMMPVMDGWKTLELLNEDSERPPVMMVTAKTAARDQDRARALGAEDFVTKPFEPADLLERMKQVMGRERTVADGTADLLPGA